MKPQLETRPGIADELGRWRHRIADLEARLESVRAERDTAERGRRALADVLGEASHELRTPLAALRLQLDRLWHNRDERLGVRELELVSRCLRSTTRIGNLVETLLEYAHIQRGQFEARSESFDLALLGDEVVKELRPLALQKGLESTATFERPSIVSADRLVVRLILVNLLASAVKCAAQGVVQAGLRAEDDGGTYRFSVVVRTNATRGGEAAQAGGRTGLPADAMKEGRVEGGLRLGLVREMLAALGGRVEIDDTGADATRTLAALIPSIRRTD